MAWLAAVVRLKWQNQIRQIALALQNDHGAKQSLPMGHRPFLPGRVDNVSDFLHFWSPHPGGANFAFADGSVRFLRYSIDPILPALESVTRRRASSAREEAPGDGRRRLVEYPGGRP